MSNSLAGILRSIVVAAAASSFSASAANIVSVVEKNGDTDRPSAKYTGLTFDIQNPNGTVLLPNYTVGTFGEDAKAMTDRVHEYNSASATVPLPAYLVGRDYIMIANNNRDNATLQLEITLSQISQVYLLIDNRLGDGDSANPPNFSANMTWVSQQGWFPYSVSGNRANNPALPDEVGIDEGANGTIENYYSVYTKFVAPGTLVLNQADNASRNVYGVVIAAIPEPGIASLGLLGAGLLFARRQHRNRS
jgi:hypothetical protein